MFGKLCHALIYFIHRFNSMFPMWLVNGCLNKIFDFVVRAIKVHYRNGRYTHE